MFTCLRVTCQEACAVFCPRGSDTLAEIPSLSQDKLKILPQNGTVWGSQNPERDRPGQAGTGRDSLNPGRDARQNGTEQKKRRLK